MESPEVQEILNRVRAWPRTQRMTLAHRILADAAPDPSDTRGKAVQEVVGMLKVTGPAPSDRECEEALEDELLRRFSR